MQVGYLGTMVNLDLAELDLPGLGLIGRGLFDPGKQAVEMFQGGQGQYYVPLG